MSMAVLRIQPIKRRNVAMSTGHVDRTHGVSGENVDADRTKFNQHYSDEAYASSAEALQARLSGLKMKQKGKVPSDETVAAEVILTASSEYFDTRFAGWRDDASLLEPWITAQFRFVEKEWGEDLVSMDLHLDELTPHFHAYVVPTSLSKDGKEKRISYGSRFTDTYATIAKARASGNADDTKLGALQTRYAAAMSAPGIELERGVRKSTKKHVSPRKFREATKRLTVDENAGPTPEQLALVEQFMLRRKNGINENPSVETLHAIDAILVENERVKMREKAKDAKESFKKNAMQLDARLSAQLVAEKGLKQSVKQSDNDEIKFAPMR